MSTAAADGPERSGSAVRVLGNFVMLALFLGALIWLGRGLFVSAVDGGAEQREYFGDRPPPFGLSLESAVRLPSGDTLVRFTRSESEASGSGPREVLFLEYRSSAAVTPLFRPTMEDMGEGGGAGARMKEWEREKAFDWHTTVKRDDIAWGQWSSKLLIERSFAKGGGWSEEARVDLSSPARALVLFVHWPVETPTDEQALRELLLAIQLAPPVG